MSFDYNLDKKDTRERQEPSDMNKLLFAVILLPLRTYGGLNSFDTSSNSLIHYFKREKTGNFFVKGISVLLRVKK